MRVSPTLLLKEITDIFIRTNFKNLQDYFAAQNQLLDFKFKEIIFDKAVVKQPYGHGLSYIPKDILQTHISGTGIVTFHYGDFDKDYMYISSTGPSRIRFLVGTYAGDDSQVNYSSTDTQNWSST